MICVKSINLLSYHYDNNFVFDIDSVLIDLSSGTDSIWLQSISKWEDGLPVSNENKG